MIIVSILQNALWLPNFLLPLIFCSWVSVQYLEIILWYYGKINLLLLHLLYNWSLAEYQFNELYYYKYVNVYLSVCLFVHLFIGHFESDLDALWHKVAFYPWKVSKQRYLRKLNNLESVMKSDHNESLSQRACYAAPKRHSR